MCGGGVGCVGVCVCVCVCACTCGCIDVHVRLCVVVCECVCMCMCVSLSLKQAHWHVCVKEQDMVSQINAGDLCCVIIGVSEIIRLTLLMSKVTSLTYIMAMFQVPRGRHH